MLKKIVDCSASWCGPCKSLAKTFENVSKMEEFNHIEFKSVDIESEEGEKITEDYQIRNVPTILFLDENDNLIARKTGNIPEATLVEEIKTNVL